ncbi:carotenoid ester lipase [Epithele typhae]|uniref:carotenoid ester lipase n=1 Tax=Epithele typhae TaxID=378194 RepID=UPI0020082CCB|nr:carotenoid ester lipase [Epithele typhae]KAH9934448.1 carotenoid ester lipase [Epithele typhae]
MRFLLLSALVATAASASLDAFALRDGVDDSLPTVVLDAATFVGTSGGTVVKYLGIPFAEPPIGDLRLRAPRSISGYTGTVNATAFGNRCFQQTFPNLTLPENVPSAVSQLLNQTRPPIPQSENCLNLNVIVPGNTTTGSKLPVAVWIYGGGFMIGSNADLPGENVVARSIELGHPIIYVAMNYRLSAFGFLGGKEVKEAGVGNLGLLDQLEALKWVQKYISAFGGDPDKVMIWGESAGSISVAQHMLANNGDPQGLFRAAFLESNVASPVGEIDVPIAQSAYDTVIYETGCADAADTLACLREVPAAMLKAAMDMTPTFLSFDQLLSPYVPRADGGYVAQPPQHQLLSGAIANIPFVAGNDKDEGTLFSLPTLFNVTTEEELINYLQTEYFNHTSRAAVAHAVAQYPADPAAGSPFDTGANFTFSPEYKRMAAIQGDYFFQGPRRLFMQQLAGRQPVFGYLNEADQVEGLGAEHGAELVSVYFGGALGDYLIRFAATLDPNGDGATTWPQYTTENPALLTLSDSEPQLSITLDSYRAKGIALLTQLGLADPM